ncbi:MAG TPA: 30S ribosomal protein S9 [Candidatus Saccharimonadales bacterium]|nr:30S ribosomal protein S9 [Candidatus Saccharimonadales bacterium]
MARVAKTEEPIEKKVRKTDYFTTTGRRKGAVARVRLFAKVPDGLMWGEQAVKKGDIIVNKKAISAYFPSAVEKTVYMQPFEITGTINTFAITIQVDGGGRRGQLGAVVHALSRALSAVDGKHRDKLKKKGLLTRDPRVRQRRKVGMGGKSRRKKQSPKR